MCREECRVDGLCASCVKYLGRDKIVEEESGAGTGEADEAAVGELKIFTHV